MHNVLNNGLFRKKSWLGDFGVASGHVQPLFGGAGPWRMDSITASIGSETGITVATNFGGPARSARGPGNQLRLDILH